jgi:hypothetical protein
MCLSWLLLTRFKWSCIAGHVLLSSTTSSRRDDVASLRPIHGVGDLLPNPLRQLLQPGFVPIDPDHPQAGGVERDGGGLSKAAPGADDYCVAWTHVCRPFVEPRSKRSETKQFSHRVCIDINSICLRKQVSDTVPA